MLFVFFVFVFLSGKLRRWKKKNKHLQSCCVNTHWGTSLCCPSDLAFGQQEVKNLQPSEVNFCLRSSCRNQFPGEPGSPSALLYISSECLWDLNGSSDSWHNLTKKNNESPPPPKLNVHHCTQNISPQQIVPPLWRSHSSLSRPTFCGCNLQKALTLQHPGIPSTLVRITWERGRNILCNQSSRAELPLLQHQAAILKVRCLEFGLYLTVQNYIYCLYIHQLKWNSQ